MSPRRAAVVDIGTNSVLLTIATTVQSSETSGAHAAGAQPAGAQPAGAQPAGADASTVRAELERATITRLGEGVDSTRTLAPGAVGRTLDCLRAYGDLIREANVDVIALVGTSALRDARGGESFVARATELIGAPLEVISGQREAELTFRGALSGLAVRGPVMVFDIGGGSTEIIAGDAETTRTPGAPAALGPSFSFDVGSVRLTERHVRSDPPTPAELDAMRTDIRALWRSAPGSAAPLFAPRPTDAVAPAVVGVAGTVTTLAALALGLPAYDPERVHGATLSAEDVARLVDHLAALPLVERQRLPGLEPRRADVVVAGAVLCTEVLRALGATEMLVSDRGVRWGLLDELLLR